MGKLRQLSLELWPLIDVIPFSYIELIFRVGVSCLPAALLFFCCSSVGLNYMGCKPDLIFTCISRCMLFYYFIYLLIYFFYLIQVLVKFA